MVKTIEISRELLVDAYKSLIHSKPNKTQGWVDEIDEIVMSDHWLASTFDVPVEVVQQAYEDFKHCEKWGPILKDLLPKDEYFEFDQIKSERSDIFFGTKIFYERCPFFIGCNMVTEEYKYKSIVISDDYEVEVDTKGLALKYDHDKNLGYTVIRFKKKVK